jgi:hypothetical protein
MFYISIFDFSKGLPKVDSYKNEEIENVRWVPLDNILHPRYKWAFNHDKFIEKAIIKFEKYLT